MCVPFNIACFVTFTLQETGFRPSIPRVVAVVVSLFQLYDRLDQILHSKHMKCLETQMTLNQVSSYIQSVVIA